MHMHENDRIIGKNYNFRFQNANKWKGSNFYVWNELQLFYLVLMMCGCINARIIGISFF